MQSLKTETGQIESKTNLTAQPYGPKIGIYFLSRGFLAAGAEDMTLENATKTFTIND